jgi:hypothetical protein
MVKVHFIGGESLVVSGADASTLEAALADPDGVLRVTHDGKPVLLAVRAIAAVVILG